MIDEELVCYLFAVGQLSVSQIARVTDTEERFIRDEIAYCWIEDTIEQNATKYRMRLKRRKASE